MSRLQQHLRYAGLASLGSLALFVGACEPSSNYEQVPAPDVASFELEAYPVLLRDCGFPACHGATDRFFRVFGPGRTRLLEETAMFAPVTPDELAQSYSRARSMLAYETAITDSWLLRKPLALSAGGSEHAGEDRWGRNVYESAQARGFTTIVRWAFSQQRKSAQEAAGPRP